jgi:hypothetical protein
MVTSSGVGAALTRLEINRRERIYFFIALE